MRSIAAPVSLVCLTGPVATATGAMPWRKRRFRVATNVRSLVPGGKSSIRQICRRVPRPEVMNLVQRPLR